MTDRDAPYVSELVYPGTLVWARDASGELLPRVAITEAINGRDFPVIWVCHEDDFAAAQGHEYPPVRGDLDAPGMPWPIEDVTLRV